MFRKSCRWKFALWMCGAIIPAGFAAAEEQGVYQVFVARPTINNYAVQSGKPLPAVWQEGTALHVTACRDEREPASFVIQTKQPLRKVDVRMGELRGKGASIPADAVDIRVAAPCFRRITDFPGTLNWVLLHDPDLLKVLDQPDPVVATSTAPSELAYVKTTVFTREPIDTPTLQPADIDDRRQFWLTVHVPKTARAGVYTGSLKITCENAPKKELSLKLTVPDFDLPPPAFEYSVYYPAWMEGGDLKKGNASNYVVLSESQYLAELRNMAEHGCLNPNIYDGPQLKSDGTLDFTHLEKVLDLRRQAGISSGALYLVGTGPVITSTKIDKKQQQANIRWVRQIVDWAKQHGHENVYLMGQDEATGQKVTDQREAWISIHNGGGKVFVANYGDFYALAGRLLDLPILLHPVVSKLDKFSLMPSETFLGLAPEVCKAIVPGALLALEHQKIINGVHRNGYKIFTYMDPLAGYTLPETHRRMRGLELWKTRLDGTMTWSYAHITQQPHTQPGPIQRVSTIFSFVLRGKEAPLDTLAWEAYREAYDDARYLAALQDAIKKAKSSEARRELAAESATWLKNVSVDANLDQWRAEMIRRTEQLLRPSE